MPLPLTSPERTEALLDTLLASPGAATAKLDGEVGRQEVVLPTRNSAAHRITVVDTVTPHSVLVTGLLTNNIFQIMGPGI